MIKCYCNAQYNKCSNNTQQYIEFKMEINQICKGVQEIEGIAKYYGHGPKKEDFFSWLEFL